MLSTVLHVEDDPALTEIVEMQFQRFGFLGTTVSVDTVSKAEQTLDNRARDGGTFDLIISDMNLPDGTGLDVVRHVRASPVWEQTPILILSGDLDPKKIGRAYALGANAYVNKSPPGRALDDVVAALYDHWAKDVVTAVAPDRVTRTLARASSIRARHAQIYQRLAELFGDNRSESAFWLSRALVESNLTNLLAFLRQQRATRHLPDDFLDEVGEMQKRTEGELSVMEYAVEKSTLQRREAYEHLLELLSTVDVDVIARSYSYLFPVMPTAMNALRDFMIGTIDDVTAWIDLHSVEPTLRARTAQLRASSNLLAGSTQYH